MSTQRLRRVCLALGVLVCLGSAFVVATPAAHAADPGGSPAPSSSTSYDRSPSKFSLTVTPTRLPVEAADIGKAHTFEVINRGQDPLAITVIKRDFTGGADGSLVFQKDATYSASEWVRVEPAKFELAPGASKTVAVTITMAPDPEPGDHQVALVFLVPSVKTEANVLINRGVGTPVYITVPGPTDDTVDVDAVDGPGFALRGPVAVTATLRSTGTVHRDFRGTTALPVDAAGLAAWFPDFTVVRDATRVVTTPWDPPLACVCHVRVAVDNADGAQSTATVRVIVFPLDLLAGLLVAGLLVVLAARTYRRRYRADVQKAAAGLQQTHDQQPHGDDAH